MKNVKKVLLILIIISIILVFAICIIEIFLKNEIKNKENLNNKTEEILQENYTINRDEYNAINIAVTNYIQALNINNTSYDFFKQENNQNIEKQIYKQILNLLSENYKQENKITDENLKDYISIENEQLLFVPLKIKKIMLDNPKTYVAEGIIENFKYESKGIKTYIIYIDDVNRTFSVEPTVKKFDEITNVKKVNNIEKSSNNQYSNKINNNKTIIQDYMILYKRLILSEPELAYELFDNEYRDKRFGSIEVFKEYINNNREEIKQIELKQYLGEEHENYTEYVAKDKNDNLYIFEEKDILDYTIKLDTYTIPTTKFIETYNNSDDLYKSQMNIDKFFQMINRKDYIASYDCLAESFKENYFKTEKEFENFVKNNFFEYNKIIFESGEQKGERLYAFEITLEDITQKNIEKKKIEVIMQINEGLDFVMSFNIQ